MLVFHAVLQYRIEIPHVTGHDLSVLPEMSGANLGLRSHAEESGRNVLSLRRSRRVAHRAKRQQ